MERVPFEHHYSDTIHNTKVALLGIMPPPLGGVSVHISRVKAKLEKQGNTVSFFNTETWYRNKFFPFYIIKLFAWLIWHRPRVVMYHSSYVTTGIAEIVCLAFLKHILRFSFFIIEHDCRHMYQRSASVKRWYSYALRSVDLLVFIGSSTHASYCDAAITLPAHTIEGAFLPPIQIDKARILATYPAELFTFIENKKTIILANAAHCMRINGADVYGLDRCIALMADLTQSMHEVGLIVALAKQGDAAYFATLSCSIAQQGLEKSIFILCGNYELWPLFEYADLFVRPTLSDGASVSIQEALFCNVPVVASNVCKRPDGVICFDVAAPQAFLERVKNTLMHR